MNAHVTPGDRISIALPATSVYVAVLRTAAAGIAARMEFTLDDVEDLRMLVDEACAVLLPSARPGTVLDAVFDVDDDGLAVQVTVRTGGTWKPPSDSFAWTVLTALGDPVDVDASAEQVSISFHKKYG